jgi:hypothetical protein
VICITSSDRELWLTVSVKNRRGSYITAVIWRATMSQHLASSGLYDEGLIDHRNVRPLTIAFATIVTVWMLAFGLVSVSGQLNAQSRNLADGCAAAISTMVK